MAKIFSMEFELTAKLANTYNAVFGGANQQLSQLKSKLSGLADTNATIGKFKGLQEQTHNLTTQFSQSQLKVKQLSQDIKQTSSPTKKLVNDFEKAQTATSVLNTKLTAKRQELGKVRQELEKAGIATINLAEKELALSVQTDKLKQKEQQWNNALSKQAELQQKASNWKSKIFTTIGIGSIAVAPMMMAAHAQEAAAEFKTAFMNHLGQVSPDFTKLNTLASQFGRTLPNATADYRQMFLELKKGGVEAENILNGIGKATAYLATVTHISTTDAGKYVSGIIQATKVKSSDAMELIDTLQKLEDIKVAPMEAAEAFQKLSGVLKETRMQGIEGVKSFAPLIAMFTRQNMGGGEAAQAISKMINASLTVPQHTLQAIQSLYGLKFKFTTNKGGFVGVENFIQQLEKISTLSASGQADVVKNLFGAKPAALAVVTELMQGLHTYRELKTEMQEQASIEQKMAVHLGLLTVKLKNWGATMKGITTAIGEPLLALAIPFVDGAVDKLQNIVLPFVKAHQTLIPIIAKVVAGFIAFKVAGLAVVFMSYLFTSTLANIRVLLLAVSKVMHVVTAVQWLWNVAIAANPLVWLFGALVAVIGVLGYFAYKTGYLTKAWQFLKQTFNSISFTPLLSAFSGVFSYIINGIRLVVGFISAIPEAFNKIKNAFSGQSNINVNTTGALNNLPSMANGLAFNNLTPLNLDNMGNTINKTNKSQNVNVHYNPTIHVNSGYESNVLHKTLKDSHQDFMRLINDSFANEQRVAFH